MILFGTSKRTDLKITGLFLWLLFHFFRLLVRISLLFQFNRLVLIGRNNLLQLHRPTIIAVNHPSTMMDVFITAPFIPRVLFFLANYSLFKNPVTNWLLKRLYCIPIKRKEDVGPNGIIDNDQAFEQSYQHLEKRGALFVAPEGVSWTNRFIRPLKTGTARIALTAEAKKNGTLGLQIIPIGLSYLPHQNAIVQIGQPLSVIDWIPRYKQHPTETVQALTHTLEQALQSLTLHTHNEDGEQAVTQIETLLQNEYPLAPRQQFFRTQSILPSFLPNKALHQQLKDWFLLLESKQLTDDGVSAKYHGTSLLLLLLGSPIFLVFQAGCVLLGCNLHKWILKRFSIYPGYGTTIKLLFNTFISFPVLLLVSAQWLTGWQLFITCLVLSLIVTHYNRQYKKSLNKIRSMFEFKQLPEQLRKQLLQQRQELLEQVNTLYPTVRFP
jgi:glycerol-3-phosphate O-acyltransferase/dihydroxyacetone phosphate acyltransferase